MVVYAKRRDDGGDATDGADETDQDDEADGCHGVSAMSTVSEHRRCRLPRLNLVAAASQCCRGQGHTQSPPIESRCAVSLTRYATNEQCCHAVPWFSVKVIGSSDGRRRARSKLPTRSALIPNAQLECPSVPSCSPVVSALERSSDMVHRTSGGSGLRAAIKSARERTVE